MTTNNTFRLWFLPLILLVGVTASACLDDDDPLVSVEQPQEPEIETEINPDVDFSQYASFDVVDPSVALEEEAPANFDSYQAAIETAIIDELTRKGLAHDTDAPDLWVNPFVSVAQVQDASSFYDAYWGWYYGYQYLWTMELDHVEGSLLIDVVERGAPDDVSDDVLVYRGVAQGLLAQDPKVIELQIRNVTQGIFADWPVRRR